MMVLFLWILYDEMIEIVMELDICSHIHKRVFQICDSLHDFVHDSRGDVDQIEVRNVFNDAMKGADLRRNGLTELGFYTENLLTFIHNKTNDLQLALDTVYILDVNGPSEKDQKFEVDLLVKANELMVADGNTKDPEAYILKALDMEFVPPAPVSTIYQSPSYVERISVFHKLLGEIEEAKKCVIYILHLNVDEGDVLPSDEDKYISQKGGIKNYYFPKIPSEFVWELVTITECRGVKFDKRDCTLYLDVTYGGERKRLYEDMKLADDEYVREGIWFDGADPSGGAFRIEQHEGHTRIEPYIGSNRGGFVRLKSIWKTIHTKFVDPDKRITTNFHDTIYLNLQTCVYDRVAKTLSVPDWYDQTEYGYKHKYDYIPFDKINKEGAANRTKFVLSPDNKYFSIISSGVKNKKCTYMKQTLGPLVLDIKMFGVNSPGGWLIDGENFDAESKMDNSFNERAIRILERIAGVNDESSFFCHKHVFRDKNINKIARVAFDEVAMKQSLAEVLTHKVMKFCIPTRYVAGYIKIIKDKLFSDHLMVVDTDYKVISDAFTKMLTFANLWDSSTASDSILARYDKGNVEIHDVSTLPMSSDSSKLHIVKTELDRDDLQYVFFGEDIAFTCDVDPETKDSILIDTSIVNVAGGYRSFIPIKGTQSVPANDYNNEYILRTVALLKNALLDRSRIESSLGKRKMQIIQEDDAGVASVDRVLRTRHPRRYNYIKKGSKNNNWKKIYPSLGPWKTMHGDDHLDDKHRERFILSVKNSGDAFQVLSAEALQKKSHRKVILLTLDELCFYNAKSRKIPAILYKSGANMMNLTVYNPHGVEPMGGGGGIIIVDIKPIILDNTVSIGNVELFIAHLQEKRRGVNGIDASAFETYAEYLTRNGTAPDFDICSLVDYALEKIQELYIDYQQLFGLFDKSPRRKTFNMLKYCWLYQIIKKNDVQYLKHGMSVGELQLYFCELNKSDTEVGKLPDAEFNVSILNDPEFYMSSQDACLEYFFTKYPEEFLKCVGIKNIEQLFVSKQDDEFFASYRKLYTNRNSDPGTGPVRGGYRYINKNTQRKLSKYLLTRFMFQRRKIKKAIIK